MTDQNDAVIEEVIEEPTEALEAEAVETEEETPEPTESSPVNKVQTRMDELTKFGRTEERARREAERDRDYWRDLATKEKSEVKPEPVKLEVKTLEDFDYDETAYQSYIFDTARSQAVEAAKHALQEDKTNNDTQARQKAFQAKEEKYSKVMPDYMEVTRDQNVTLTKEMVEIAASSDKGPELLYHLAKNPDISASIARLSPLDAAREMGRIEATKLTKETNVTSKAPPPAKTIKGGDPVISKTPEQMTQNEFNEYRRKVIAKRGN